MTTTFNRRFTQRLVALAVLTVPALLPRVACPADATDHLNVQEPERPGYLAPPPDNFRLPPVKPLAVPLPPERPETVLVRQIVFDGNTVISARELDALVAPYLGKRLNEADIEEIRLKITQHYIDQGYINSGALLRENALSGDTLKIGIVEGHLQAIRLHGMERLDDGYLTKRFSPEPDAVFNVDRLRERFQLMLDDPLFKRMNARITPGDSIGQAVLDVDVERARPYQLSVFANNYRPPSIDSTALGLSGWVRNLTGFGDSLEVTVQGAPHDSGGTRTALGWRMPLNTVGTQLSLQLDHGKSSVVEEPMRVLDIESVLDSKDIGLSQTIVETLNHRLTIGANHVKRENRTSVAGEPFSFVAGEPNGTTRVTAWRFWQEYSFRSEKQVVALRSTFTSARNNLDDMSGLPATTYAQADQRYRLWLGQFQYAGKIADNGTQIILRGTTQRTSHDLLSLDRMSIGGVYTVRGYRENQLVRDKGHILNVELDYPLIRSQGKNLGVALIPFYDFGRGQNQGESADRISSVGVATRVRWQGVRLDLAIAKRLSHPGSITSSGGTLQDKAIHLQLAYDFF
jgi:hemolysin activation/secretion protein